MSEQGEIIVPLLGAKVVEVHDYEVKGWRITAASLVLEDTEGKRWWITPALGSFGDDIELLIKGEK